MRIFYVMIQKLKRETFNRVIGDKGLRKALAFAIWVKDNKPASVIKGWSYTKLSEITGCSRATCKNRITALRELGLVSEGEKNGVRYLHFLPLRAKKLQSKLGNWYSPKRLDIHIGKIDRTSVKTIELGLCAMLIVEIQTRKNYVRQVIRNKDKARKVRDIKRARRICSDRGWTRYVEYGISMKSVARRLGCGVSKAASAVENGEANFMFVKQKWAAKHLFVGHGLAKDALGSLEGFHYATRNNLYRQPANTYALLPLHPVG